MSKSVLRNWRARGPDLNPQDYCFWYMQLKYEHFFDALETREVHQRTDLTLEENGGIFLTSINLAYVL